MHSAAMRAAHQFRQFARACPARLAFAAAGLRRPVRSGLKRSAPHRHRGAYAPFLPSGCSEVGHRPAALGMILFPTLLRMG